MVLGCVRDSLSSPSRLSGELGRQTAEMLRIPTSPYGVAAAFGRVARVFSDGIQIRDGPIIHHIVRISTRLFNFGLTRPILNISENVPSENDRFANLAISGPKTSPQPFRISIWTKFSGDDFIGASRIASIASRSLIARKCRRRFGRP